MVKNLVDGFILFASVYNIAFIFLGVALGVIVGALPGVGSSMTLAICTPMTFKMPAESAIMFLFGIYVGAYYGGSISAILINTPGTATACATVLDGYPMAKKGQAGRALDMALYSSIAGHLIGVLSLIFLTPLITKIAMSFTPYEYFSIILFSLTIIATVTGKNPIKGLLSATLGMAFTVIGLDPIVGVRRLTFNILDLDSGIALLPMLIGLFAVAEVFRQAKNIGTISEEEKNQAFLQQTKNSKEQRLSLNEFFEHKRTILRSSLIGTFIGILPGIGGSTAAFVSYGRARIASKNPENFGEGEIDGICAAETANNAVVGSSLVPLLTLGIPGSVSAAILLNAFLVHGLIPGPRLLIENNEKIYSLFVGLLFSTIVLYIVGKLAIRSGIILTKLSIARLFPFVLVLCIIGAYSINNSMFDLKIMVFFGILGYLMQKYQFPLAPFVIAFVLAPTLEISIRQSMLISRGNLSIIFTRPIVILFFIFTIITLFTQVYQDYQQKKKSS